MKRYRLVLHRTNASKKARLEDVMTKQFNSWQEAELYGNAFVAKMKSLGSDNLWNYTTEDTKYSDVEP